MSRRPARILLVPVTLATLLLTACSGGDSFRESLAKGAELEAATETPSPQPAAVSTPTPAPGAAAAPASTATLPPGPALVPSSPPPAPAPAGRLQFNPPQLQQGGIAIVYLNEPATSATLRFQERQYPMLHDGARWWALVGAGAFVEPGLHPISVVYTPAGRDTTSSIVQSITVVDRDFPVEYIELAPGAAALLAPDIVQAEIAKRASIFSGFTAQRMWSGPFLLPARGAISSRYGEGRSYNGGPVTDYHRGTDFVGDIGAPVFAPARGIVVFTGELRVRGNAVMIDHGAGVFTAYHHLSEISVAQGQLVAAGERIGAIGSTGLVTGPHLHWEIIVRGVEVDGEPWLGSEVAP